MNSYNINITITEDERTELLQYLMEKSGELCDRMKSADAQLMEAEAPEEVGYFRYIRAKALRRGDVLSNLYKKIMITEPIKEEQQ